MHHHSATPAQRCTSCPQHCRSRHRRRRAGRARRALLTQRHFCPLSRRQEYKRVIFREETFISKRPPLPPNSHVDFITERATIPHEWPLSLPASRFILETKPAWQADAPPATWHCGGDCSCGDFHHSEAQYLVGDVKASTTIGRITNHIAAWLRRLPELRRLHHVLGQPGCTVRMLLLDDGPGLHGSGGPTMRVLAPTSTAKEVGLFNNRDRIFITVDELSPFSPPLPTLHTCFEVQGASSPPSPPSSPPAWPPWLPSSPCEAPHRAAPPPSLYEACSNRLSRLWKSLPSARQCCVAMAALSGVSAVQPALPPHSRPPPSPPCSPAADGTGAAAAPQAAAPTCGNLQQQRFLAAHAAYVHKRNANRPKREEHIALLNNLLAERRRGLNPQSDGDGTEPPERSANLNLPHAQDRYAAARAYEKLEKHVQDITRRPIRCCFNCAMMMYPKLNDTYKLPASSYVTGKESCRGYRVARPFIVDFASRHGLAEDDVFRCSPSPDGGYEVLRLAIPRTLTLTLALVGLLTLILTLVGLVY